MKKIYGIFVCNNLKNVFNLDKDLYEIMNKTLNFFYIVDLSLIYGFSQKYTDHKTNLEFDPKNNNVSAIVKDGHVNISLVINNNNDQKYNEISNLLKQDIQGIPDILSIVDINFSYGANSIHPF